MTPIGKICVIKTLALSRLNHIFLSIPAPTKKVLQELEKIFFKFIWDGKPDKIKRTTLVKPYHNGGLNMINLTSYICALKTTWIHRVYNNMNAPWVNVGFSQMFSLEKIFSFGSEYAKLIAMKSKNKFWAEVLNSWSSVLESMPIANTTDALCEPLWHNPKISKTQMIFSHWYQKGIQIPADLMYGNGKFISQQVLEKVYGLKTNFLEYHRAVTCVKLYLGKLNLSCDHNEKPNFARIDQLLLKSKKGSRDFYQILRNRDCNDQKPLYSYWEQTIGIEINSDAWKKIYRTCFKTIRDNDIIWLQYRLLHRILGTKDYLFKIKLTTDRSCSFCKNSFETVYHLFTGCSQVKLFWENIKEFFYSKLGLQISIDETNIIFDVSQVIVLLFQSTQFI